MFSTGSFLEVVKSGLCGKGLIKLGGGSVFPSASVFGGLDPFLPWMKKTKQRLT